MFNVEIQVHHGMPNPIVYKLRKSDPSLEIIHLQCLSGIHFNPVINRKDTKIKTLDKYVNCIYMEEETALAEPVDFVCEINMMVQAEQESFSCRHNKAGDGCTVVASVGNTKFCALIDTGAQVNLISEEVWSEIRKENLDIQLDYDQAKLTGIGNKRVPMLGIVDLKLSILGITTDEKCPFAVVKSDYLPMCGIVGANFIVQNQMVIDFNEDILHYQNSSGEELYYPLHHKEITTDKSPAHILTLGLDGDQEGITLRHGQKNFKLKFSDNDNIRIPSLKSKQVPYLFVLRAHVLP